MLKVGITGAGGQIGSMLATTLGQAPNLQVVATCRNSLTAGLLQETGCVVRVGSIVEEQFARRLLDDCDVIIHCALASGDARKSRLLNESMIHNLARLTDTTLVIYLSSVAVYGSCIDSKRTSFERPCPDTYYGREKLHLERVAIRACAERGVRYCVLRVGHVYGPGQWLSRRVVDMAEGALGSLPYDGRLPSNAIRSDRLASAVNSLVMTPDPASQIRNVADVPQTTWRQVCDWHTDTLKMPAVAAMPAAESGAWKRVLRRDRFRPLSARLLQESVEWLRSLPRQYAAACPSLREAGLCLLARSPLTVESRLKKLYVTLAAAREIERMREAASDTPPAWLFSDAMPGPYLGGAAAERGDETRVQADLVKWYERIAGIEWIAAQKT